MPRGKPAMPGDKRTAPNGYHYTRTNEKWRLTHHMEAERKLGRPLRSTERVYFKDKNKDNMAWDNLVIMNVGEGSSNRRKAELEARIQDLQAQLDELKS